MSRTLIHTVDGIERSLVIRWSNNKDVQGIQEWLREEDALEVHGNFLCNWSMTQRCHEEGTLLVLIDVNEDIPVAYQWGQLLSSGILQVRNSWRGEGLGLLMVEHCVGLALQQDEMVLQIECKPSTSIPFWERMGFTIVQGKYGRNATGYRVLSKELEQPQGGVSASVVISFYSEEILGNEDYPALARHCTEAIIAEDGKIHLAERAAFSKNCLSMGSDLVIEIMVEGELIYRDKAKRQGAKNHGVNRCCNGFYIDTVSI